MKRSRLALAVLATAGSVWLAGCGGGGGSGEQASITIKGVAATGAPLSGATIQARDANGTVVASAVAAADGSYTLSLPAATKAPLVVTAAKDDTVLYAPMASTSVTTVNVTPITTLVAAQLSPTGDPAALAAQIKAGSATVDSTKVQEVVTAINTALAPLMKAVKAEAVDPISGSFKADGTGYDQALNALNIDIKPTGTSSNIAVTVKAATAEGQQPPEVVFVSGDKPPVLPATVASATLPPPSTDSMIANFLARIEQCYKLPVAQRVSGDATVAAPACKDIFYDNNATAFLNNGVKVGKDKAWSLLWSEGSTGATFSSGSLLFLSHTGEMLVSWKGTAKNGNSSYSRAWLKPQDGQLKAYGNQYKHVFGVRPLSESRDLINTDRSYTATGFGLEIPNVMVEGAPAYDRVVVTAPSGRQTVLVPSNSLSFMAIKGTSTSVVRLAGQFWNPALSQRQPREMANENIVWARNPLGAPIDWTDEQIAAMPNLSRWQADFYLAGNTGSTPDVTQYAVTTTRPLTTAEISQRAFAKLTPAMRKKFLDLSPNNYVPLNDGDTVVLAGVDNAPAWEVPPGAQAPTLLEVGGHTPGTSARWNDSVRLTTGQRTATVNCSSQGSNDPHCLSGNPGKYANLARLDLIQFSAYDMHDMKWLTTYGAFKPTLPAP